MRLSKFISSGFAMILSLMIVVGANSWRFNFFHATPGDCYVWIVFPKEKWEKPKLLDWIIIDDVGKEGYAFRRYYPGMNEISEEQTLPFRNLEKFYKKASCFPGAYQ